MNILTIWSIITFSWLSRCYSFSGDREAFGPDRIGHEGIAWACIA
jgi:hypothetical protein